MANGVGRGSASARAQGCAGHRYDDRNPANRLTIQDLGYPPPFGGYSESTAILPHGKALAGPEPVRTERAGEESPEKNKNRGAHPSWSGPAVTNTLRLPLVSLSERGRPNELGLELILICQLIS